MTLIKDLIHIPERLLQGDFVVNLGDSVHHPGRVMDDYVVTPQLADCFHEALDFVHQAAASGKSKAAYLHGSFGSGKSHFMAVLNLLLAGHGEALAQPALAAAVAAHRAWLLDTRLLVVPAHMLDAPAIEPRLFGAYLDTVGALHPDAPPPAVFRAEGLLRDAANLRAKMGDPAFFKGLAGSGADADGLDWGDAAGGQGWTAADYDRVAAAPMGGDKDRLLGDLAAAYFPNYAEVLGGTTHGFTDLDTGLAALTRHARGLGYRGIVLFLDELILWLMSKREDAGFVSHEVDKIAKLVEFTQSRELPVISFIARQRDMSEVVGTGLAGQDQHNLKEKLSWFSGRFHTLTLEDRNLPAIAEKRVLRPKSPEAAAALRAAFDTRNLRREVEDVLLTETGDSRQFARLYPFTPALLEALVALSSVLQRERTAIKILFQLLVADRHTLTVGQVVPVGRLFDAVADEPQPFSPDMKKTLDTAKKLYHTAFRPLLLRAHGLDEAQVAAQPHDAPAVRALHADSLLVKTLLMSGLVPDVPCFRDLTVSRLVALNWGQIRSPIPGGEVRTVLHKLRTWGAAVGGLKIGDGPDPVVHMKLVGVDTGVILEKAEQFDMPGSRLQLLKAMVLREMGIDPDQGLPGLLVHKIQWRGSERLFDISFENVRDLPESSFKNRRPDTWKLIIDYPFDKDGHTAKDDESVLTRARDHGISGATAVWLPQFLSAGLQSDLGTLVKLGEILKSDTRYRDFTSHLSEADRVSARVLLGNMKDQLTLKLEQALRAAYGLAEAPEGTLEPVELDSQWFCFHEGMLLQRPVGADLREGLHHLADQLLAQQFPDHPRFPCLVKTGDLRRLYLLALEAARHPDGRVPTDKPTRKLTHEVAVPLGLAAENDRYYVPRDQWDLHFDRVVAQKEGVLVEDLRLACDLPRPRGLTRETADLLIRLYCARHHYQYHYQGQPWVPDPARWEPLPDEARLRRHALPEPAAWAAACAAAAHCFGLASPPFCSSEHLNALAKDVKEKTAKLPAPARRLLRALENLCRDFGLDEPPRLQTARAVVALVEALEDADAAACVQTLAALTPPTTVQALGAALHAVPQLDTALENLRLDELHDAARLPDPWGARAREAHARLGADLAQDELTADLVRALQAADETARACHREAARALTIGAVAAPAAGTAGAPMRGATPAPSAPRDSQTGPVPAATAAPAAPANRAEGLDYHAARAFLDRAHAQEGPGKRPVFAVQLHWEEGA